MKKAKCIITVLVALSTLLSTAVPIGAAEADKMRTALAQVKSRIDIPADLSEFRSEIDSSYAGGVRYGFTWTDKDDNEQISIASDESGRIEAYHRYCDIESDNMPMLADISREEARDMAEGFLKKSAPELFADENDCLVYDGAYGAAYGGENRYRFMYTRRCGGVEVSGNRAQVSVDAYKDTAYVSAMNISWDYDVRFADEKAVLENPEEAYFSAFPLELVYQRRYSKNPEALSSGVTINRDVVMQYSFKDGAGYISAQTGEALEPDSENEYYGGAQNMTASKEDAADAAAGMTKQELDELERMEGLIPSVEAERILRAVKELKLTEDLKLEQVSISRSQPWYYVGGNDTELEKYRISLVLGNEENNRAVRAAIDAKTGEIISISNYAYNYESNADADAQKEIESFLRSIAAEKLSQLEEIEKPDGKLPAKARARRLINGVPYNGNYMYYSYDEEHSMISGYSLVWDEYTDYFANPSEAMDIEAAKKKVSEYAPLELVYIKNGGEFRLCLTVSEPEYYTAIDALTGERINEIGENTGEEINYGDIDGHWAEEAVKRLADAGILMPEKEFRPNDTMTQKELLTLLANAFDGGSFDDWDEKDFYDMLTRRGYIEKDDARPEKSVMREDAFVYMVSFMGYDKVARLTNIYKCNYDDSAEITPSKIGYAAILTGFGVVSGDAGALRAKDEVTRAEAVMMVYKFMRFRE